MALKVNPTVVRSIVATQAPKMFAGLRSNSGLNGICSETKTQGVYSRCSELQTAHIPSEEPIRLNKNPFAQQAYADSCSKTGLAMLVPKKTMKEKAEQSSDKNAAEIVVTKDPFAKARTSNETGLITVIPENKRAANKNKRLWMTSKNLTLIAAFVALKITAIALTKYFGPRLVLQSGLSIMTASVKTAVTVASPFVTHFVFPVLVNTINTSLPYLIVGYIAYRVTYPLFQSMRNTAQEAKEAVKKAEETLKIATETVLEPARQVRNAVGTTAQSISNGASAVKSAIVEPIKKDPVRSSQWLLSIAIDAIRNAM